MGFGRRAFIQMSVGGSVGILFTPVVWKALDDVSIWTQNWGWIPRLTYGEVAGKAAVSKICTSGCAVKVRTVAGKAFGTEGDTDNILSQGGICPLCANGVQLMRSPNRIKAPMKKVNGKLQETTWEDASAIVAEKIKAAGSKVACISGDETGTANEVFAAFLAKLGSDDFYKMPSDMQAAAAAWNGVMGGAGQVGYDAANADLVVLAGADSMESWGATVYNQKAFANGEASYIFAGPVQTRTAAVAKQWVPVPADGMAAFLLGVAYNVMEAGKTVDAPDFAAFKSMVAAGFNPTKVEAATGVKATAMADLAKKLLAASKPVVVPGGCGVAANVAAFALNMLLGRLNQEGGMTTLAPLANAVADAPDMTALLGKDVISFLGKGTPEVLLAYDCNPVYALPEAPKAGFLVSFSTYMDETAAVADVVLPAAHPYERFDDVQTPYGVAKGFWSGSVPVSKPELAVMAAPDYILQLAAKLDADLGAEDFGAVIAAKAEAIGAEFDAEEGAASHEIDGYAEQSGVKLGADVLAKAAVPVRGTGKAALAPYSMLIIGTANQATAPNAPCVISNKQLLGYTMVVQLNSATAAKLGVAQGDKVKLSGGNGSAEALVDIYEGVFTDTIAAPLGFGHTVGDEFSKGRGANVYKVLTVTTEAASGASVWSGSTVNVTKI